MFVKFFAVFYCILLGLQSFKSDLFEKDLRLKNVKKTENISINNFMSKIKINSNLTVNYNDPGETDGQSSFKLPNNVIPTKYELFITTRIDKGISEFSGNVKIHVKVLKPSETITLHSIGCEISEISLTIPKNNKTFTSLVYYFDNLKDFLIVNLPYKADKNENLLIKITYTGTLRNDSFGFHRLNYIDSNNKTIWIAATLFGATYARQAFPCFDEPWIRSNFKLEIQHNEGYHAISNMPVISRTTVNQSSDVITSFMESPPMQTYLLAFVVSDFKYIETNNTEVPQRIYARSSAIDLGQGDFVAKKLDAILKYYEDFFEVRFTLPKLDHVVLPGYSTSKKHLRIKINQN